MSDDEKVRVTHQMPQSLREEAQAAAEWGELSDRVRAAYKAVAYGTDGTDAESLRLELESIRDRKDGIREQIRSLESELDTLTQRETRVEERLADAQRQDERYEGHVESIETQLRGGQAVWPGHSAIKRAASIGDCTPEDVIAEIRERNPELPDHAFIRPDQSEYRWRGVDTTDRYESN